MIVCVDCVIVSLTLVLMIRVVLPSGDVPVEVIVQ